MTNDKNIPPAGETPAPRIIELGNANDQAAKMREGIAALLAIPEAERSYIQSMELYRLRRTLRLAQKHGLIKQPESTRPRAPLVAGEEVRTETFTYWVDRVKADGRLRLTWSGGHHGVGAVIRIKDVRYLVTGAGPRQILLRLSTEEECARMDGPWAAPESKPWTSAEVNLGAPAPKPAGPSASQLARQQRKNNRAQGELERRMKRAAAAAPAGSIGAALAGGA